MYSDSDVLKILRGDPEQSGEIPDELRPTLDIADIERAAARLRRELKVPPEATFWDPRAAIDRLDLSCVYAPVRSCGGECVIDNTIVLSAKDRGAYSAWLAMHGVAHIHLGNSRLAHSEGDVILLTAELCFRGALWASNSVRRIIRVCRTMTPSQLYAWASRRLDHGQLELVFGKPEPRPAEVRRLEEVLILGAVEPDASALLPELASNDDDEAERPPAA